MMVNSDLSKKRLKWQCRRGMLELDVLLNGYLDHCFDQLSTQAKTDFSKLLALEDTTLYMLLIQQDEAPEELQEIVHAIKHWGNP